MTFESRQILVNFLSFILFFGLGALTFVSINGTVQSLKAFFSKKKDDQLNTVVYWFIHTNAFLGMILLMNLAGHMPPREMLFPSFKLLHGPIFNDLGIKSTILGIPILFLFVAGPIAIFGGMTPLLFRSIRWLKKSKFNAQSIELTEVILVAVAAIELFLIIAFG